jgi:hypothetical protein
MPSRGKRADDRGKNQIDGIRYGDFGGAGARKSKNPQKLQSTTIRLFTF